MYHTFFQWGTSKEARAQFITAGLKNPTPDVSRAIPEAEASGKSKHSHSFHTFLKVIRAFHFIPSPITHATFNVSHLLIKPDKQPADSLTKVAALDIDNLLIKMPGISKGILFNVQQALLKEWGTVSLGILLEDTMQEQLTWVTFNFSFFFNSLLPMFTIFPTYPYLSYYFDHFHSTSFPLLSGFKSIRTGCPPGGESRSTLT